MNYSDTYDQKLPADVEERSSRSATAQESDRLLEQLMHERMGDRPIPALLTTFLDQIDW